MAASTPRGINYPTYDDIVLGGPSPSALADDFAALASSADSAITAGVQEAKDDATTKYGGLPQRVTNIESINASQTARIEAIEENSTKRGVVSDGSDLSTWRGYEYHGDWYIASSASAATMSGLPSGAGAGSFVVLAGPAGYAYTTHIYFQAGLSPRIMWNTMTSATEWSGWQELGGGGGATQRRIIPDNSNVDEFYGATSDGPWYVTGTTSAATITGLPDGMGAGSFDVIAGPPGHAWTTQLAYPAGQTGSNPRALWRSTVAFNSGVPVWSDWASYGASGGGAGDPFEPVATGMKNADLLDMMIQRKGGTIGTNGLAAFALRLDHGTTAFRDHLGPMLKQYGLPATMAVYSEQNEVNAANHDVPWSVVESWHHTHGMSFGNHSDDHLDKPDAQGWYGGTIGSLAELKTLMPNVPIEQYIPHGSVGYDRYGGFNQANTHEAIVGTLAGRMALSSHALIAGYRGDRYRPIKGRPMQGETHWSMEESTVNTFKFMVDAAINRKQGLAVMFHPEFIGLTGKMTWAMVDQCLAYVAQKRDEGLIIPLTLDGLAVADVRNDWRDDLIDPPEALMQNTATIYGNFTETPGAFTSSTPGQYVRHAPSLANRGWAYGGTRVAQWNVSSTAGATVTLKVQEGTDTPPWISTRTVTVPAGESVQYLPFGLPLVLGVQSLRIELHLDSGDVTIHECHAYAV